MTNSPTAGTNLRHAWVEIKFVFPLSHPHQAKWKLLFGICYMTISQSLKLAAYRGKAACVLAVCAFTAAQLAAYRGTTACSLAACVFTAAQLSGARPPVFQLLALSCFHGSTTFRGTAACDLVAWAFVFHGNKILLAHLNVNLKMVMMASGWREKEWFFCWKLGIGTNNLAQVVVFNTNEPFLGPFDLQMSEDVPPAPRDWASMSMFECDTACCKVVMQIRVQHASKDHGQKTEPITVHCVLCLGLDCKRLSGKSVFKKLVHGSVEHLAFM